MKIFSIRKSWYFKVSKILETSKTRFYLFFRFPNRRFEASITRFLLLSSTSNQSLKSYKWSDRNGKTDFLVYWSENFFKNICWVLRLQFQLFCSFLKNAPDNIDPSGHFVAYEIFCCSNFYNFFSIVPPFINQSSKFFQWIFLWYLSTSFVKKQI